MKTFRTFGCIVAVIFMSANFLACKEEVNDDKSGLKLASLGIAQIKSYKKIGEGGSTVEQFQLDYTANGTIAAMESPIFLAISKICCIFAPIF